VYSVLGRELAGSGGGKELAPFCSGVGWEGFGGGGGAGVGAGAGADMTGDWYCVFGGVTRVSRDLRAVRF